MQHRRPEDDILERELVVRARLSAAGEEGLQRLRGELDDAVALDRARPAAFEVAVLRAEHAELHGRARYSYGSVWTCTSEISGRSVLIRSSTALAVACACSSSVCGSRPRVRKATRPPSVSRKRSSRGGRPVSSWTMRRIDAASLSTAAAGGR